MEYSQQQSTSSITIVNDTHTTTSPVTTLSVVECLTTSSSVVTSISGQAISAITTTTGTYVYIQWNPSKMDTTVEVRNICPLRIEARGQQLREISHKRRGLCFELYFVRLTD